ncbi:triple helix repeat-containing collagen [Bacteriophage sp.]|nr:triple helix repeat-containing collagen [Bacteriophage sp.]
MPFNGSGAFVALSPPNYPAVAGQTILASMFNANMTDLFSGLSNCVTRDGQSPATANLPMGGYKHTNAGAASASGEYLVYGQSGANFASVTLGTGVYSSYNGGDIAAIVTGGATRGSLIEAEANCHLVIGLRENAVSDTFSIVSGGGDYISTSTYDLLCFQVYADGRVKSFNQNYIKLGSSGADPATADADDLVIEGSSNSGMTFMVPDASYSKIAFASTFHGDDGQIRYYAASHQFVFYTDAVSRMTLSSSGLSFGGVLTGDGSGLTALKASAGYVLSDTCTFGGFDVGWRDVPKDTAFTRGKCFETTSNQTLNTGFAAGSCFSIFNNSAAAITITQGAGLTLYGPGGVTGSRTLAARGMATIWCSATNVYKITGEVT